MAKKTATEILKEARLNKGLTQVEVGKKAGLGKNTYEKIEQGVSKPTAKSALKIMKVLDIDQSKLADLVG